MTDLHKTLLALLAATALTACDTGGTDAGQVPVEEVEVTQPEEVEVVVDETPSMPENWMGYLIPEADMNARMSVADMTAGDDFYVALSDCPFDDEGWMDEADPYASLLCGTAYYGDFDGDDLFFTGIFESTGGILRAGGMIDMTDTGADLQIWGIPLTITQEGRVMDGSNNDIGYIAMGSLPADAARP